jgi:putative tricarboxylic transport membrane protein
LPDVPTLQEEGWDESVEMFVVLVAPKGLPADVRSRLDRVIDTIAKKEDFRRFIEVDLKMGPVTYGKENVEKYMKTAFDRFGRQAAKSK